MNIEEAISRSKYLNSRLDTLTKMYERRESKNDFFLDASVSGVASIRILVDKDEFYSLIERQIKKYEEEVDKIKPVIDMANAALKGIENG